MRQRIEEELEEEKEKEQVERKEKEEYEKWKKMFDIEEAGIVDKTGEEYQQKLLQDMEEYITMRKVVTLESLVVEFDLTTEETVENIKTLESRAAFKGIMDDRGKYIVVDDKEIQLLVDFMNKRGRVSKQDLTTEANKII